MCELTLTLDKYVYHILPLAHHGEKIRFACITAISLEIWDVQNNQKQMKWHNTITLYCPELDECCAEMPDGRIISLCKVSCQNKRVMKVEILHQNLVILN